MAIWQVPKMWEDGDVYILGGGPSVTKQFNIPDAIVQEVVKGESPRVYSPYMSFLHNKHVIGINVSYLIGDWMDMVFFGDSNFLERNMQNLIKFPGIKCSCHHIVLPYNWIKYIPRDRRPRGISGNSKTVCWNGNSGAAAISVAAHAGAKRIILLGFDMHLDLNAKQHWHNIYKRTPDPTKLHALPFHRHLPGFPVIAHDAKIRGIEILNCCPDSAIECFKKINITDLQ
jgi:hypothetical protein